MPVSHHLRSYLQHIDTVIQEKEFLINNGKNNEEEEEEDSNAEEKELLFNNFLKEIENEEYNIAVDKDGSRILESLFKIGKLNQIIEFFQRISEKVVDLSFNCFGSRVIETLIHQLNNKNFQSELTAENISLFQQVMEKMITPIITELKGKARQEGGGEEEEEDGWGWIELMNDTSATHVVRTLFQTFADIGSQNNLDSQSAVSLGLFFHTLPRTTPKLFIKKEKPKVRQSPANQILFADLLYQILKDLNSVKRSNPRLDMVKDLAFHVSSAGAVEVLIAAVDKILQQTPTGSSAERKTFKKIQKNSKEQIELLIQMIIYKNESLKLAQLSTPMSKRESSAIFPWEKSVSSLFRHRIGSHVLQTVIKHMNDEQFLYLYNNHVRTSAKEVVDHQRANFVLQQIFARIKESAQTSLLISELIDYIPSLLDHNRSGVIFHMLQSAVTHSCYLKELYTSLLKAILGEEYTKERNLFVAKLFEKFAGMNVDPSDLFLTLPSDSNADQNNSNNSGSFGDKKKKKKKQKIKKENKFAIPSLIIYGLLLFPEKYSKVIAHSFTKLEKEKLFEYCCDNSGSYVIEYIMNGQFTTKLKQKITNRLEKHWVAMAKTRMGSRCLDAIYQNGTFQQKEIITKTLSESEKELKKDYFGKFAIINCKVDQYLLKSDVWKSTTESQDRKRKMFEDIFNDSVDNSTDKNNNDNDDKEEKNPKKKQKISNEEVEENIAEKKNVKLKVDRSENDVANIMQMFAPKPAKTSDKKKKRASKEIKKSEPKEKKEVKKEKKEKKEKRKSTSKSK